MDSPHTWAKLKNLEVLDLRGKSYGYIKIDKVIAKMESLRHLYAFVNFIEVGLGNMRKLQTLHLFRVKSSSDVYKIQGMSGVSKLGIDMCFIRETPSGVFTCFSLLENLFHLSLSRFSPRTNLGSLHRVTRLKLKHGFLPVYFPPNISHLTINHVLLDEDSMTVLEKLPNLLYLKLQHSNKRDRIMVITSGGFPTLKVLCLQNINGPCKMEIEESAMPELNQFIIRNCQHFDVENLPERIKSAIIVQPY